MPGQQLRYDCPLFSEFRYHRTTSTGLPD